MKKFENGITIISLVITIIVMLILAGVSITVALNGGIFEHAQNAKELIKTAQEEEIAILATLETEIDAMTLPTATMADAMNETGLSVTSKVQDTYGNTIVVPAGFRIIDTDSTDKEPDTVPEGIVIRDVSAGTQGTKDSEFVWIPVGTVYTTAKAQMNETNTKTIELDRYEFADGTSSYTDKDGNTLTGLTQGTPIPKGTEIINNYYQELETSNNGSKTAKNLTQFLTSVENYGGYYIGRYEAGLDYGTDTTITLTTSNSNSSEEWTGYQKSGGDPQIVCKGGVQPWNYITQKKAASLSRTMYGEGASVTSDLINSYAWDTAIVFIQECTDNKNYSYQNRLQSDSSPVNTGLATDGTKNDVRCNIYDMAGNCYEWSTETSSETGYPCVIRGGSYYDGRKFSSFRYSYSLVRGYVYFSFRPILYF